MEKAVLEQTLDALTEFAKRFTAATRIDRSAEEERALALALLLLRANGRPVDFLAN